jgi:hypothetical protein
MHVAARDAPFIVRRKQRGGMYQLIRRAYFQPSERVSHYSKMAFVAGQKIPDVKAALWY